MGVTSLTHAWRSKIALFKFIPSQGRDRDVGESACHRRKQVCRQTVWQLVARGRPVALATRVQLHSALQCEQRSVAASYVFRALDTPARAFHDAAIELGDTALGVAADVGDAGVSNPIESDL